MASQRATFILATAICGLLAVAPALAENVPLPVPAPQAKSDDAPVPPAPIPAAPSDTKAPAASGSSHGLFPFSLPFGGSSDQATAFTPQQRALLDRVSKYLSGMQTLVGNFVQIAPDGSRTDGTFYIQKPGKVRFEYNPPSPTEVIADGSSVAVRNREIAATAIRRHSGHGSPSRRSGHGWAGCARGTDRRCQ